MSPSYVLGAVLYVVLVNVELVSATAEEDQLFEDLLYLYNKDLRPVQNESDKVVVMFGASFIRLIDLDEKEQVVTSNVWLEMRWNDPKLKWNPNEYNGIKMMHVGADNLWLPDIVLYNNAAGDPHVTIFTDALVYYDGMVVWKPPAIYRSFCEINIEYFPYDEQQCQLKFGGWTHEGTVMDMLQLPEEHVVKLTRDEGNGPEDYWYVGRGMDLSYYYRNAEWDLLNLTSERHEKAYPGCCGLDYYIDITFYIHLRRKTLFYTVNLVVPCLLIALMTTFVFYLPGDGKKITFSISIMVTLSVFFLVLVDLIPPTSIQIPLIGRYLLFTIILVTASVIFSVCSINLFHRQGTTHKMPRWIRFLFLEFLPPLLCLKPQHIKDTPRPTPNTSLDSPSHPSSPFLTGSPVARGKQFWKTSTDSTTRSPRAADLPYSISGGPDRTAMPDRRLKKQSQRVSSKDEVAHPYVILRMVQNLEYIANHFRKIEDEQKLSDEWSYVSMVVDRILFIIFTLINLFGSLYFFGFCLLPDYREPLVVPYPTTPLGGDTRAGDTMPDPPIPKLT